MSTRLPDLGLDTGRLDGYRVPLGLVALVVGLRPLVAHDWVLGFGEVASTMLIWMLFVAAFNLLFGYTGLLSFGHATFLGFGVYAVAITLVETDLPFVVGAALGVATATVFGYLLGRLIVEKGEIYFAMLTLAVSQAVFFIALKDPGGLTGGSNGITGDTLPAWIDSFRGRKTVTFLPAVDVPVFGSLDDWYVLVAVVFLVCMLGLWQVVRSPFGRSLVAIRENEDLARAMGIDARRYKITSFTLSAWLAGVAGVLREIDLGAASIETFAAITSGDAVLMAILGGVDYFFGPVVGAFAWLFAENYLTGFETLHLPLRELSLVSVHLGGVLEFWEFFIGGLFVVVVLVSPKDGIWGYLKRGYGRLLDHVRGADG
jgi:branched-chain amino acid transport system permease protein